MEPRVLLSVTGVSVSTVTAVEGVPTPIDLATFSDGVATDPTKYDVSVDYGDGTTVATSANDTNLKITNTGAGTFMVTDVHTFPEETIGPALTIQVTVNETGTANTDSSTSTGTVSDGTLNPGNPAVPGTPVAFSGVGGTNTAGGAFTALQAFETAIGGVNNGASPPPAASGFRAINWDGVKLDGTDFGGSTTVIDPGKTVGIPVNRFQERGVQFDSVYAVSGDGFTSVNPSVSGKFPAFSPSNTFAMFNDHSLDVSFVLPSAHTTSPVPAATKAFGAIFINVHAGDGSSIEYFHGNSSLGKFDVPPSTDGDPEFLGEVFSSPVVTRVSLTLGSQVLFSFNGTTFHAVGADTTKLAVTDDFVYAEPTAMGLAPPALTMAEGAAFTGTVATFSDDNLSATAKDFTGQIQWGDGHASPAIFTKNAQGGFDVSGTNTFGEEGSYRLHVSVQDLGGNSVGLDNTVTVTDPAVVATGGVTVPALSARAFPTQTLATFTDPGGTEPNASDPGGTHYSATVDWGDGTPPSAGIISLASVPYTVSSSHVYAVGGTPTITVTIHHEGATDAVVTSTASVLQLDRMFRAYNPNAAQHVFTSSGGEFQALVSNGLNDETFGNPGFSVLDKTAPGALPVHRLYNPNGGQHYLTTSNGERDALLGAGWNFEKEEGFVFPTSATPGTTEVFLLYNSKTGDHIYTASTAERDSISSQFPGIWSVQTSLGFGYFDAASPPIGSGSATVAAQTRAETAAAPVVAASLSAPLGTETLQGLPVAALSSSSTGASGSAGSASTTDTAAGCPVASSSASEPSATDGVFSSGSWIDSVGTAL